MTDTTTIRIDDRSLWRDGDILTVFDADGKKILEAVLVEDEPGRRIAMQAPLGSAVRHANGAPANWLTSRGRTYTVTREVPALPTEPNTILLDVATSVYPHTYSRAQRDAHSGRWHLFDEDGDFRLSVAAGEIVAYTPVTLVPGERVEVTR